MCFLAWLVSFSVFMLLFQVSECVWLVLRGDPPVLLKGP
jgi:hypothetical protein